MYFVGTVDERQSTLDGAVQEGKKFHAALQGMITWLDEKKQTMQAVEPVSGQKDLLTQQKLEHEVISSKIMLLSKFCEVLVF